MLVLVSAREVSTESTFAAAGAAAAAAAEVSAAVALPCISRCIFRIRSRTARNVWSSAMSVALGAHSAVAVAAAINGGNETRYGER